MPCNPFRLAEKHLQFVNGDLLQSSGRILLQQFWQKYFGLSARTYILLPQEQNVSPLNIATLVQGFVNRPGYVSGNYLGLRCSNVSGLWKQTYQWDNSTHRDGAILRVT